MDWESEYLVVLAHSAQASSVHGWSPASKYGNWQHGSKGWSHGSDVLNPDFGRSSGKSVLSLPLPVSLLHGVQVKVHKLDLQHIVVANFLTQLCKGMCHTMAAFCLKVFLNDFGCKLFSNFTNWGWGGSSVAPACWVSSRPPPLVLRTPYGHSLKSKLPSTLELLCALIGSCMCSSTFFYYGPKCKIQEQHKKCERLVILICCSLWQNHLYTVCHNTVSFWFNFCQPHALDQQLRVFHPAQA